jgi:SP family myo-inositol transporter-like MFS transporter 13
MSGVFADREDYVQGGEEEEGEVDESRLTSPGAFIWTLTVCAGVSGLLFGYEYVVLFPS